MQEELIKEMREINKGIMASNLLLAAIAGTLFVLNLGLAITLTS